MEPDKATSENVKEGDIIVVVRNGSRALIGKHAEIKESMSNTVIGAFMSGIRSEHSSFVNALLDTNQFEKEIEKNMGATINQITGYMFSKMEFTIPSPTEQDKIGNYFKYLDHLITLHQRKLFEAKNNPKNGSKNFFRKIYQKLYKFDFNFKTYDWEQRKLGEIAEFNPKSDLPDEFEYVDLESVVGTEMVFHRTENKASAPSRAQRVAKTGDVFFQTVRPYQRNNYLFSMPYENYVFSTGYAQMRPKINAAFLMCFLQTESFVQNVLDNCTGTSYPAINSSDLSNLKISLPILKSEQSKIGKLISNLDHLITLHQRKCDQTKELKKTMLQKMFPKKGETVPEIRFPEFTDAWEECKLGEVGNTFTGLSGKTKEDFGHGEGKFITYMNVFSNPVADLDGLEGVEIDNKQFQVKAGDVLFTTSSETPEEVGMSSMWLGNADNIYLNSFCFGYRPTIEFDNYYLAFMFRSAPIRKKFQLLAQGISRYNISKNKVMEMSIPVPSIEEQEKIGSFFKHLDTLIALHQSKCDSLKELKKTLLRQLFV